MALVHEWFTTLAGAEKVVEQVCELYPEADLYAIFADPKVVAGTHYLNSHKLYTSFIKHLPRASRAFRSYLALMPLAIEQFDLSAYDVVISSSHAVAKGVLTGPEQLHVSYVHTPIRYAWDLQHQYLREAGLRGLKGWIARLILHVMRIWDYRTSAGVDHFVANSHYVARRIRKVYGRESAVIYPPVDVSAFGMSTHKDDFYLAASRLVPYKKMDLIAAAFSAMPNRRLVVIGAGPELAKVRAHSGPNVELLGYRSSEELRDYMQRARALVFAAEEDFGIIPVEAQACGTPVIAFGKGGAQETIRPLGVPRPTGLFFEHQDEPSLIQAIEHFESNIGAFEPEYCRSNALRFSVACFREQFASFISQKLEEFNGQNTAKTIFT